MAKRTLEYLATNDTRSGGWLKRTAMLLAFYPVFLAAATYGTWLAAWAVLGRRPNPWLSPGSIHPAFAAVALSVAGLWAAAWPVMLVYSTLVGALLFRRPGRPGRGVVAAYLAAAVAPWVPVFLLLETDPGHVIFWLDR